MFFTYRPAVRVWDWVTAVAVISVGAAVLAFSLVLRNPKYEVPLTVGVTTLAALAGLFAAVATTLAAVAARQSAAASLDVSAQSREALARAVRPSLALMSQCSADGKTGIAQVGLNSQDHMPAADVTLTVVLEDDRVLSAHAPRLDYMPPDPSVLDLTFDHRPPRTIDPVWSTDETDGFRSAVVEFSDTRGIGRWRQEWKIRPAVVDGNTRSSAVWVGTDAQLIS